MATATPVQSDAPRSGIKALLARHPLFFFFLFAYAFSWLTWMPLVLSEDGAGLLSYRWRVFNNTKGSVFIAVLVHATFDTYLSILNRLFPVPIVNDYGSNVPILIGFGALALVLVALTRGRLGYQHYRQEDPNWTAIPNVEVS